MSNLQGKNFYSRNDINCYLLIKKNIFEHEEVNE